MEVLGAGVFNFLRTAVHRHIVIRQPVDSGEVNAAMNVYLPYGPSPCPGSGRGNAGFSGKRSALCVSDELLQVRALPCLTKPTA